MIQKWINSYHSKEGFLWGLYKKGAWSFGGKELQRKVQKG